MGMPMTKTRFILASFAAALLLMLGACGSQTTLEAAPPAEPGNSDGAAAPNESADPTDEPDNDITAPQDTEPEPIDRDPAVVVDPDPEVRSEEEPPPAPTPDETDGATSPGTTPAEPEDGYMAPDDELYSPVEPDAPGETPPPSRDLPQVSEAFCIAFENMDNAEDAANPAEMQLFMDDMVLAARTMAEEAPVELQQGAEIFQQIVMKLEAAAVASNYDPGVMDDEDLGDEILDLPEEDLEALFYFIESVEESCV